MSLVAAEIEIAAGPASSAQRRRTRAGVRAVLRRGLVWTAALMVLPGLLSSRPVENAGTGLVVGLAATALMASGLYVWRSYLAPYRRVRGLIDADLRGPAVIDLAAVRRRSVRTTASTVDGDWYPAA